jgi:hypothetical protein
MFKAGEMATSAGVPIIILVPEIGMVYKVDSRSKCKSIGMTYSPSPSGRGRGEGQAEPGRAHMRVGVRTKPYGYDAGAKEPSHLAFTKPYSA